MPGGWDWAGGDDLPTPQAERRALNSWRLTVHLDDVIDRALADRAEFKLSEALLCSLHAIAWAGEPGAGEIRTEDVTVGFGGVVVFEPPPWQDVRGHLERAYVDINAKLAAATTSAARATDDSATFDSVIHAAAYALWRLNWIHPFVDGNGRTARAIAYAILCVGFDVVIPGSPTVPELIVRNSYPYRDALRAADVALNQGTENVRQMEGVLLDLVEQQIVSHMRSPP
jgi:Fic family protein